MRNIVRHKTYTFLNVFGLSLGLSCFILILLYVRFEFSFDKFNENYDNIYRVELDYGGRGQFIALTNNAIGTALVKDYPEVINQVRFRNMGNGVILDAGNNMKFFEDFGRWAENSFFEIFTYRFIAGNPKTALAEPYSIVLTKSTAEKYFADENPMGKTIKVNNDFTCTVTAVLEDLPKNSSNNFNYLISFSTYEKVITPEYLDNWNTIGCYTYVLLQNSISLPELNSKIKDLLRTYISKDYPSHVYLKPLSQIHLYSDILGEHGPSGDPDTIIIYSAIGIFILLIASINFMNLSTARSMKRAKEVGMRKVCGAGRRNLITQFIGESIVMTFISLFISIIFINFFITEFNAIVGRQLSFDIGNNLLLVIVLIVIGLIVGVISGSYPAFYLSKFNPVGVLKSAIKTKHKKFSERNVLVVFQFATSVFLIVSTIMIYYQLNYLRSKDVGYDKENVIVIGFKNSDSLTAAKYDVLKDEIKNFAGVKNASISQFVPHFNGASFQIPYEGAPQEETIYTNINFADKDFLKTYRIKLLMGKDELNTGTNSDSTYECFINEAFMKETGWDNPIGKRIGFLRVAGVIKDYQFTSMKNLVQPIILRPLDGWEPRFINREMNLSIKLNPGNKDAAIDEIKTLFSRLFPYQIFEYRSMKENFEWLFRTEDTTAKTAGYFSILAIFISCLGLFGLSSFTAEQKRKEIGIRKVLGGSVLNVVYQLVKESLLPVVTAIIIALPVAYYFIDKWLQEFAYRIEIPYVILIISSLSAIIIALITVGYQSVKAALSNPVDSIKYE
jgi:putative ABC transport system permease protein